MTIHASLLRATEGQRDALRAIVDLHKGAIGPKLVHTPLEARVRFERDWVGDDAAYVTFVFRDEPELQEVDKLRDAIIDDVRTQNLPLMIYVSAVLESELAELESELAELDAPAPHR
jgi:hypothetical protein